MAQRGILGLRGPASGAPPANAVKTSGTTRHELERTVFEAIRHDFHAPSRTHIVWCPGIGRGATKGFGDAADEAHRAFMRNLTSLLDTAAPGDLARWMGNLAQDAAERTRERHVRSLAARERMGEYSISLDPTQRAALNSVPGEGAANARIVQALRGGLAKVEAEAHDRTDAAMRAAVASHEELLRNGRHGRGEDLDVRTVRMDAELHARLQLLAHEMGVKLSELCRYAVGLHLSQAGSGAAALAARPVHDPFEGMTREQFAEVAQRLKVKRALISKFRDRRIKGPVPGPFMVRLCESLPSRVPVEVMHAHLAARPRLPEAAMYRAGAKPEAIDERETFEEAVLSSGMSEKELRHLLSD